MGIYLLALRNQMVSGLWFIPLTPWPHQPPLLQPSWELLKSLLAPGVFQTAPLLDSSLAVVPSTLPTALLLWMHSGQMHLQPF